MQFGFDDGVDLNDKHLSTSTDRQYLLEVLNGRLDIRFGNGRGQHEEMTTGFEIKFNLTFWFSTHSVVSLYSCFYFYFCSVHAIDIKRSALRMMAIMPSLVHVTKSPGPSNAQFELANFFIKNGMRSFCYQRRIVIGVNDFYFFVILDISS